MLENKYNAPIAFALQIFSQLIMLVELVIRLGVHTLVKSRFNMTAHFSNIYNFEMKVEIISSNNGNNI